MDRVGPPPELQGVESGTPPPTSHAGRIRYLDGWRGLSILLVLVGHFPLRGQGWVGSLGVELFFVLSGRLMADILFVERFPLPEFYKRRISRIFPAMAVFILVTWFAARGTELGFRFSAAATGLTFVINYAMALTHGVAAIENLWSLCIEEHAYVLLGLFAWIARRRALSPMPALLLVAAASMADALVSSLLLKQDYFSVYWRTDAHLASIFLSVAAYLALRNRPVPAWTPIVAFAAGVTMMAVGPDALRFSAGTACFALAVNTLDRAPRPLLSALSWRGVTTAGVWSYSIYLWQQPFFRLGLDGRLPMVAALALGCAFGVASYFIVEQPARRWLNSNWKLPATAGQVRPALA
jgi:peptidoglycan/LPS O-acetylase OafA/YrhL